jgi:YidC/Oxa1 family membrane protein insertase
MMQAIILCIIVALVWTRFTAPKQKPADQASTTQQVQGEKGVSPIRVEPGAPSQVAPAAAPTTAHPKRAEFEAAKTSFVQTSVAQIGISHLGGRVVTLKLSDYKVAHGSDQGLDLIDNPDGAVFPLGAYAGLESDENVSYTLVSVNGAPATQPSGTFSVPSDSTAVLEFKGTLQSGNEITKKLSFTSGSYVLGVEVSLSRKLPEGQYVWLEWAHFYPKESANPRMGNTQITYLDLNDKIHHIALTDVMEGVRGFGPTKWSSLGDIYFMTTIIPLVKGANTLIGRDGEVYLTREPGGQEVGRFEVYAGPKDYKTLQFVGDYHLERTIDLGWFSFLALPLLWLLHYLYLYLHNYGMAIIALTLIVKTVMLPLSKASYSSMKKMQEVQPEIKALRERIKDPTQLNQEIFALYQRRGINPMGGCFPIAIQIPVFLGLYNALLNSIELRHAGFALWITDLSAPERLEMFGVGVPVMVLLMSASMIIQQWTTPNPSADPQQQKMMMLMPVVFAAMFIIYPMPAGLVLYWLVNNIISITQQVYMRNTAKGSVYTATFVTSLLILGVGYILTLI